MTRRLGVVALLFFVGCPKSQGQGDGGIASMSAEAAERPRPQEVEDLWARAKDEEGGVDDDLARLARREGVAGLMERGAHPAWRRVAARALGHTEGYAALPWLAEIGAAPDSASGASPARSTPDESDALAALESAVDLAAQPRRQGDPEDADDLRAGSASLLGIARDPKASRKRRVLAVRALRMLSDKGFVKTQEIPTDVDAR